MKIKTNTRASLIRLTFFDLNKKGLVFASLLLVGLVFVGGVFWHVLQENRYEPKKISKTSESFLPLTTPEVYDFSKEHTSDGAKDVEIEFYERSLLIKPCYDEFFYKVLQKKTHVRNPEKFYLFEWRLRPYTSSELKHFLELDYSQLPSRIKIKKMVDELHKAKINERQQWQEQPFKSKPGKGINPNRFNETYAMGTTPPDKIKAIMDRQEYQAAYQNEIEKYDALHQTVLKEYEDYKISTLPKLDKDQLPKDKESGVMGFLGSWWDGLYGDVRSRDKGMEYRKRRAAGKE